MSKRIRKGQEVKGHWRSTQDMPWFGHWDILELGEVGKDNKSEMTVTIEKVTMEEVKDSSGRSELCPVAHLDGNLKGWVLNRTNMKTIESLAGTGFTENWKGVSVTVFCDTILDRRTKEKVDCIRVRPTPPKKEPTLKEVLSEIDAIVEKKLDTKTLEAELMKVWKSNPSKRKDATFVKAISNAKTKGVDKDA